MSQFNFHLISYLSFFLPSLLFSPAVRAETGDMPNTLLSQSPPIQSPGLPSPAGTRLIFERFYEADYFFTFSSFYLERFMGNPGLITVGDIQLPGVLIKNRSFDGKNTKYFDELYIVSRGNCQLGKNEIKILDAGDKKVLMSPKNWDYQMFPGKTYSTKTPEPSYELIAYAICDSLNPLRPGLME